jgi:transposase
MTTAAEYIGIDVAKATLAVGSSTRLLGEFPNTPAGFKAINRLLSSLTVACVVFESTGIYGHHAIEALMRDGYAVAVVQPNSVRHFALSQKIYAKTDAIDATVIARFGAATKPRLMVRKAEEYVLLRAYSDRREQIIAMRVSEQNHLEACLDTKGSEGRHQATRKRRGTLHENDRHRNWRTSRTRSETKNPRK